MIFSLLHSLFVTRHATHALSSITDAVLVSDDLPSPGAELAPDAFSRSCAFLGVDSVSPASAESAEDIACSITPRGTPTNETVPCGKEFVSLFASSVSLFAPSLPPASAFRRQPISPPGKSNIVAILRKRELDSRK